MIWTPRCTSDVWQLDFLPMRKTIADTGVRHTEMLINCITCYRFTIGCSQHLELPSRPYIYLWFPLFQDWFHFHKEEFDRSTGTWCSLPSCFSIAPLDWCAACTSHLQCAEGLDPLANDADTWMESCSTQRVVFAVESTRFKCQSTTITGDHAHWTTSWHRLWSTSWGAHMFESIRWVQNSIIQ